MMLGHTPINGRMIDNTDDSTIIVVGAGIAGCHAARELASEYTVTVVERSNVAAEATGLSAGLIAPALFYGDIPDVATHITKFVREFDGTHGFEFTERDRLDFIKSNDVSEARNQSDQLANDGFPVSYLDAAAVADRYPQFDQEQFAGAVFYRDTGWVDPYTYANALRADAEERGATVETSVTVTELLTEDGSVTGVQTTDGRYDADAVVVAAGWRTQELLPDSVTLQARPYRTQCIVLSPDEPLSAEFPLGRLGDEHLYFRPEHNGDLLIGGAHETISDPTSADTDADESFTLEVANFIPEFIQGFKTAEFVNGWSGVDVATPDTRPIIDAPANGPDGLIVATGFNGLGVTLSPVVGPVVRHRLTGESIEFSAAVFDADRFSSTTSDFEYVSTSEL